MCRPIVKPCTNEFEPNDSRKSTLALVEKIKSDNKGACVLLKEYPYLFSDHRVPVVLIVWYTETEWTYNTSR
ncbi:hypothetical protein RRG08_061724 [Elysia crispata]|uniref:Uncharacterized protein n=1 Tax=Elysia crispata TaxID=231223 RepID=A0AAE1A7M1_9GAST|nr:hypothetical protein RRG08_061724 [Elysia crispata]